MKKILLLTVIVFSFASFTPKTSFFCACCGERGQYDVRDLSLLDEFEQTMLKNMQWDQNVELFAPLEFEEAAKGLQNIKTGYEANDWRKNPYYFKIKNNFSNNSWNLNFKTIDGKTGALNLPLPRKIVSSKIDTHDTPEGNEVVLYKELRIKGTVQNGDGFFKLGLTKPATYFLVFQGRGNNCDNAGDYMHWRLEIKGANADYVFFGKMNTDISN